jgi:hypothetical protein
MIENGLFNSLKMATEQGNSDLDILFSISNLAVEIPMIVNMLAEHEIYYKWTF